LKDAGSIDNTSNYTIGVCISDGYYSSIRIFNHSNINIRCYNTIRNENYPFKCSRNAKRLIIIGIVASNTDIRMFKYSIIRIIYSGPIRIRIILLLEYTLHL
jgi:hypothetical protein